MRTLLATLLLAPLLALAQPFPNRPNQMLIRTRQAAPTT
jgi:hypothetical protein